MPTHLYDHGMESGATHKRDYGAVARIGLAVPRANPTAEPEFAALLPRSVTVYVTRLVHDSPEVEQRLRHYLAHLDGTLKTFGSLRLDAFGVACTGSSYVVGPQRENELTAAVARQGATPVLTATQALRLALSAHGASRIALVSPYPAWLADAGHRYWRAADIDVRASVRVDPTIDDTHAIYELTSDDAYQAAVTLDIDGVDALVLAGTGMPTLRALARLRASCPVPVLSSTLCLAWAMLTAATPAAAPRWPMDLLPEGFEP